MKKAFTLVEMLIVVIIIGILMGALLPKLKGAQERARDTARKANLSTLSTALQMYFNDKGTFPTGSCLKDISSELVPTYISNLPSDPQKQRKTFGTKVDGCKDGDYAYSDMFRKGGQQAGAVLIANIEAAGTVGNFILPQASSSNPQAIFTGKSSTTKIGDKDVNSDSDLKTVGATELNEAAKGDKTVVLGSAEYAEKMTCASTKIGSSGADYTMCNRVANPSPIIDGKSRSNNSMVYVLFN